MATSGDDLDLDGFSELDKLEPVETTGPQQQQQTYPPQSLSSITTCSNANNLMQNNETFVNGVSTPASIGQQPHSQQMHNQQEPNSVGQPPQQQQSVLQELLLTQSSASTINNSPRPQQQIPYSSNNYPNKSPMPHSIASTGPQSMSPMGMNPQRLSMGHQQMRQSISGHPFDQSMPQAGTIPLGNYIPQTAAQIMGPQQFVSYQQHPRPSLYGSNAAVRMPQTCATPQQTMRQTGFSSNISQHAQQSQIKGIRQQTSNSGVIITGNAPTAHNQGRSANMTIGQPGISSQNIASFDSNHQSYQQMVAVGTINGTGTQQRQSSLSETPNGYILQSQMMNASSQAQQIPAYINGQIAQNRASHSSIGFVAPSHHQMPSNGPMDIMTPSSSQQTQSISQIKTHSQAGMILNGTPQMLQVSRHTAPPPVSAPSNQNHPGVMVAQSPAGLINSVNSNNQHMRVQQEHGGFGASNPPIMQGQSQDPEKRKLIQQQLVLLLHAHKCQQRERLDPQNWTPCTLPYCDVMKGVLQHMVTCNAGRQCQYPHCASSRQIIAHWKNCNKEDCPVCNPLKKTNNQNTTAIDRRQGDMLLSGTNFGNLSTQPTNQPSLQSQNQIQQGISGAIFGSPPSQNTSVNNLLDGYNPNTSNPFRSTNPPNKVGSSIHQQMGPPQVTGYGSANDGMPPPEPPSQARDWHATITPDLRNHLVGKLVKAIFPSPDPAAIHDQRIRDLISYARKVEKDMFEAAPDKEAYYHMLAEKIYKIQKELQEKKNRRLNEQQMQHQLQRPSGDQFNQQSHHQQFEAQTQVAQQHLICDIKQEPKQEQNQAQPVLNFVDPVPIKRLKLEEKTVSAPSTNSSETMTIKQELNAGLFPPTEDRRSTTPKDAKPSTSTAPPEPIVRDTKIFDPNELREHLMPVWQKVEETDPDSIPFRVPVNPIELKIPDYFDVIKNPIDLQTIKSYLDEGKYKNPWEFCDHMWLMFENAWLYNRKNTKIHKMCTRLSEIFIEAINPAMRKLGYCCGQKLSFTPLVQFCFGITKNNAACVIARDQPYYMYESSSTGFGVTVAERYIYCVKCFESLPDRGINLNENTADPPSWIAKAMFQKMKNDQIDMEPFEHCQICDRKWHRICSLHSGKINPEGFICQHCREDKKRLRPENKFTAKKLPHCQLSRYIEDRVSTYLKRKLTENDPQIEVVIRVLSSSDKEVEVKPQMLKKYGPDGYPDRFPYRSKAVFAFEVLKDPETGVSTEICFFGLYVQEYGTNCAQPNQRRVYIAYLDSVHFFQPRHLRTSVYYEILLGYLQYVKRLGYTMAHIWACPPSEGDDYIFHCHPPEQKIPKPKRLQDWYKTMLNNGNEEGTVHSYKDIFNQAKDDGLDTPMKLPYFEGDYWPRIIDECIASAEKEEEVDRRKVQEEITAISDDDTFQTDDGLPVKKQQKSTSKKKNNLKKSSQNNKKKGGISTGNPLVDRLFQQLEKHRDVFFTIKLFSHQDEQNVIEQKPEIEDPDSLISCELMDTRDNFLAKSREEHWEFSQLRRAKWSTLNFCYTLHTQEQEGKGLSYNCNECEKPASYHCNNCDDYDLCENCKGKINHPHEMEKLSIVVEQKSTDTSSTSHNDSVKKCISSLVHACTCRDRNCRRPACHKMKKVISHTKGCKRRQLAGANCAVCKQLIALCCYHAKHCTLAKCQVPFCSQIRLKLQEQKRSQNRQAERMMQRRMMKLHSVGAMNGNNPLTASTSQQIVPPTTQIWTQPPQSPLETHIPGKSQFVNSNVSQLQQMPMSNPQGGMMVSNAHQQPLRFNGPMASYSQVQNSLSSQNQLINTQPINVQSHQIGSTPSQHTPGYQMMGQQMQPIQSTGQQPIQRTPSTLHTAPQQILPQPINPPPYIRPGTPQAGISQIQYNVQTPTNQTKFMSQQRFQQPSTQRVAIIPEHQQLSAMGMSQQPQMRQNDVNLVLEKLNKAKNIEEREMIFAQLRKTPYLLNAFIKMTKKGNDVSFMQEMGMMQQQQIRPPTQQQQFAQSPAQFYQGSATGMVQPQIQQNGNIQFNSPPQHQWMQSPHQPQIPHTAQPPQRNPT